MTRSLRLSAIVGFALTILLAACGTSSSTSSSTGSTTTTGGYYGSTATATTAATTSTSSTSTVQVATATVGGMQQQILTDAKGMTLYYLTKDTATSSACSGGCLSVWPPLLAASGTPTGPSGLTGTLSTLSVNGGMQVLYNNHLLYTYAHDSAPGDVNGQGVGGVWFVATVGLK